MRMQRAGDSGYCVGVEQGEYLSFRWILESLIIRVHTNKQKQVSHPIIELLGRQEELSQYVNCQCCWIYLVVPPPLPQWVQATQEKLIPRDGTKLDDAGRVEWSDKTRLSGRQVNEPEGLLWPSGHLKKGTRNKGTSATYRWERPWRYLECTFIFFQK